MKKYLSVFKISFQQEFAYRINFIMWRVRNVLQIFLIFFLWDTVFADPGKVVFGYNRSQILTYVFGILIMRSVVLSARSVDVAGDVSSGRLTNYLIRPVSYFKYWFTRDLSSKALNLSFASIEFILLFVLLKPPFFFQTNFLSLVLFILSLGIAVAIFFLLLSLFSMFSLWHPEQAWGPSFLLLIFVEFLGGGVFPLDILPAAVQRGLYFTPFPHLLFIPLQTYLGQIDMATSIKSIFLASMWLGFLFVALKKVWSSGLKIYKSEGR